MNTRNRSFAIRLSVVTLLAASAVSLAAASGSPPVVGEVAKDFTLVSLGGETVSLSTTAERGPVVLVVLRGYPGYQCPICTRQFGELLGRADELKKAGANLLFVYPGPSNELKKRADEFVSGKDYPAHYKLLLDPDFEFTNAYGLRWDSKGETAYPSTFVIDSLRKVTFSKVSKTHGDRANVADVMAAVAALQK